MAAASRCPPAPASAASRKEVPGSEVSLIDTVLEADTERAGPSWPEA